MLNPLPLRIVFLQRVLFRLPFLSYSWRMQNGAVRRPQYGYCILNAALLAKRLGIRTISVVEFGVAYGDGLLVIEEHVAKLRKEIDVDIQVYGFDTGEGLPPPTDFRDLPYHWQGGFYAMDQAKLRAKLKDATLVLGNIKDTVSSFFTKYQPAPIGCAFFDMDYYTSTAVSLDLFRGGHERYLPRVFCYLDDVIGTDISLYNEFTGELLAIKEFNELEPDRKFARTRHLSSPGTWHEQIYIFHDFKHPRYCDFVSEGSDRVLG